jgi:hypothetical protein
MRTIRVAFAALSCVLLSLATFLYAADARIVPHGRLEILNGYTVVSLDGTPEQMGTACGQLLGETIQRVVKDMIIDPSLTGSATDFYRTRLARSAIMETYQPEEYRAELRAMATAAKVKYEDLLLLQYFGDVDRARDEDTTSPQCTSFAILPPNTRGNVCLAGRNFDYFYPRVNAYAGILIYYRPAGKIPFVTVTWAGVINGWTLLNANGIVVSNNTAYETASNSLKGMSTCFLLRYVAERAKSVAEGIALVEKSPRACATNMLIASGNPPDAVLLEFDQDGLIVRRPNDGFVGAANHFVKLHHEEKDADPDRRVILAEALAREKPGRLTLNDNIAGAEGVPLEAINHHSAMIDATNRRLRIAMGETPACKLPYRAFRLTDHGLVAE